MRKILLLLLVISFGANAQRAFFLKGKTVHVTTGSESIFSNVSTSQSGNTISIDFDVARAEAPAKPTVERVTVSGTETDGQTLTASYSGFYSYSNYSDASTWTWYRADNAQSVGTVVGGATSSTYVLSQADVAKVLRPVLTPVDGIGTVGDPVTSVYTGTIQDDEFNPVTDIAWHIAHLPADYSTGVWIDRGTSGGANNSVQNGSDNVPTATGNGADFESSNNEELVLDQPSPQMTMPVEIWIKAELESYNAGFGRFAAWTSSQLIEQRTSGRIYLSGGDTGYNMPTATAVWMRFVISGTSSTSKFTVNNGTPVTNVAASTSAFGTSNGRLGANSGGTGNRLDGKIYYFFVRQGELSAPQVSQMWTWTATH